MNFIMIGLLLREALDRLRVRLNVYLAATSLTQKNAVRWPNLSCCGRATGKLV